jgi:hypothetical protein
MVPEAFRFLILAGGQGRIRGQNQKPIAHLFLSLLVMPVCKFCVKSYQWP